jgi:hypothetical protein
LVRGTFKNTQEEGAGGARKSKSQKNKNNVKKTNFRWVKERTRKQKNKQRGKEGGPGQNVHAKRENHDIPNHAHVPARALAANA